MLAYFGPIGRFWPAAPLPRVSRRPAAKAKPRATFRRQRPAGPPPLQHWQFVSLFLPPYF